MAFWQAYSVATGMREFRWQILARWVTAVVLALSTIIANAHDYVESVWPLFAICAFIALYNLLISLTGLLRQHPYAVTHVSQFLDICALTLFLHYSGDLENPLIIAYCIPVAAGTVIVSKRAGFLLAGVASSLFFLLVCATLVDAFPIHVRHHHLNLVKGLNLHLSVDPDISNQGWGYILTHCSCLTGVLFAVAFGFGTLSERIREKEAELKQENERLLLLLRIVPEGVVLLNRDGRIMIGNQAAQDLVGASTGGHVSDLDLRLDIAENVSQFEDHFREFETSVDERLFNHILARGRASEPIVWIIRDLTQQHALMAQLMHQSKMADLGLLGAGIAHEIGNPLSSISAILQLIEMRKAAPDIAERLAAIRSHVDRMSRIIQDMRDFSRPSTGRTTRVSAVDVLEKALHIFNLHEKSRGMKVVVEKDGNDLCINVVEDQIVQVLLNLLLNAADASSSKADLRVRLSASQSEVLIAIVDRGVGMSDKTKQRLFTPFFTTKEPGKGVGLGLFISEAIVTSQKGRIIVKSSPGAGATFTVHLPRCRDGD